MGVSVFLMPAFRQVLVVWLVFLLLGSFLPGFERVYQSTGWLVAFMAACYSMAYWLVLIISIYRLKTE